MTYEDFTEEQGPNFCGFCEVEGIYEGWLNGWDEDSKVGIDCFTCPECGQEWNVPITADGELIEW